MTQADAYRAAYRAEKMTSKSIIEKASVMMTRVNIAERVAEIRAVATQVVGYTLAEHLKRLDALSAAAESEGKFEAAVKAEELRGKAAGLYVEQKKIDHTTKGESLNRPQTARNAAQAFDDADEEV